MTEPLPHETVLAPAADVLDRLPAMGRVMVVLRAAGATHERIGPVEAVTRSDGTVQLAGPCHDALVPLAPIARISIDRSSVMQGKTYPRLVFHTAGGETLFAVVGMEGVEAFDAALTALPRAPAEAPETPPKPDRREVAEDDPGRAPFDVLVSAKAEVTIRATVGDVAQSWHGKVEAVKPAMGFLNVMTPDFHLHLAGGTVTSWKALPGQRIALGLDGQPTGLTLTGDAFA